MTIQEEQMLKNVFMNPFLNSQEIQTWEARLSRCPLLSTDHFPREMGITVQRLVHCYNDDSRMFHFGIRILYHKYVIIIKRRRINFLTDQS